jgi:hypothetical protein
MHETVEHFFHILDIRTEAKFHALEEQIIFYVDPLGKYFTEFVMTQNLITPFKKKMPIYSISFNFDYNVFLLFCI